MESVDIRQSIPDDEGGLKRLWKLAFGDGDDYIDLFFNELYSPGMATVLTVGGKVASAMYTLSGAEFISAHGFSRIAYAYALGTLPEYRGRGYGAMVNRELARAALGSGCDAVALLPSEESLYGWYERELGAKTCFRVREKHLCLADRHAAAEYITPKGMYAAPRRNIPANRRSTAGYITPVDRQTTTGRIVPADGCAYARRREVLLEKKPHVAFDERFWSFAARAMGLCGGGLFLLELPDAYGCAAIDRADGEGEIFVKELILSGGGFEGAAEAIALEFGVKELTLRGPAFQKGLERLPVRAFTVVIQSGETELAFGQEAYFGLALD